MFGIGISELLVIFLVALLVLGPERLPAAARTMAKLFGEFRRATDDLRSGLVGISDIDQDWRREHNNPRIIKAESTETETQEASTDETKLKPSVVAKESENIHG